MNKGLFGLTPRIEELSELSRKHNAIDKELYVKYDVKQGLRDSTGEGVLTGLTNISDVNAKEIVDGKVVPRPGNLYYRGYNIKELVHGFENLEDFGGFEEAAYLLLFGELPTQQKLNDFRDLLISCRRLPPNFVRDIIMKAPSRDMMNSLSRSILSLYTYDPYADDTSLSNVMRQSINLIAQFPMLMVYGYHAYNYHHGQDLFIRRGKQDVRVGGVLRRNGVCSGAAVHNVPHHGRLERLRVHGGGKMLGDVGHAIPDGLDALGGDLVAVHRGGCHHLRNIRVKQQGAVVYDAVAQPVLGVAGELFAVNGLESFDHFAISVIGCPGGVPAFIS